MYQSTTPSLSQTIDEDRLQDSSSASLWSRSCSLWLLVIPKAQRLSLWDNWGEERGCDEVHWHGHTRGLPGSLREVVGTVQQVHCSRSLGHSIRSSFNHMAFFPRLKQNFIAYRSFKVQIAFLKFTSCDNQALVGCIPIAAVAVHLNLKS